MRFDGRDTTEIVVKACRLVGRPIFFSVLIMLISFLPVFTFGGQEGKLSHPLAFTKSFAVLGVALLAITLVPALIPLFIRGKLKGEEQNPIVRSFIARAGPEVGSPPVRYYGYLADLPWRVIPIAREPTATTPSVAEPRLWAYLCIS